jgi:hypothetical protein
VGRLFSQTAARAKARARSFFVPKVPPDLEINFPTGEYSQDRKLFGRRPMAKLHAGEKRRKINVLWGLLRGCLGLREAEIAETLRWDRRTVNNYLRELKERDQAYKEGRQWHADE